MNINGQRCLSCFCYRPKYGTLWENSKILISGTSILKLCDPYFCQILSNVQNRPYVNVDWNKVILKVLAFTVKCFLLIIQFYLFVSISIVLQPYFSRAVINRYSLWMAVLFLRSPP